MSIVFAYSRIGFFMYFGDRELYANHLNTMYTDHSSSPLRLQHTPNYYYCVCDHLERFIAWVADAVARREVC